MPSYSFYQVDVFSNEPRKGNPVAVVVIDNDSPNSNDSTGLSDELMQSFANWTNLSETTFLFTGSTRDSTSTHDYDLRIWTPKREMPFAGHPTLGSCKAWLQHTGRLEAPSDPSEDYFMVTQRCKIGLVKIRVSRSTGDLAFAAPPLIRSGPVESDLVERACKAMRIESSKVDAQWVDNGPGFFALRLGSAQEVLDISYSAVRNAGVADLRWGVFGPYDPSPDPGAPRYEVRLFAPAMVSGEDPVTGSLNAGIATWLGQLAEAEGRRAEDYVASQGTKVGRKGRVNVGYEYGQGGKLDKIWVGGNANICIEGQVTL